MADDEGRQSGSDATEADLAKRFSRLNRALDQEREERVRAEVPGRSGATGYALAVRLGSEFVAAVIVGVALGWGLDSVAGTAPWGLIVFLLLGFAAGVMNVLRAAGRMTTPTSRSGTGE